MTSTTQPKHQKDLLLILFIIPNAIGALLYLGWITFNWLDLGKPYEFQPVLFLRFGLAISLLFIYWGLWTQKRWAAILLLIIFVISAWTGSTILESYQLIEEVWRTLLAIGVWWIFVGRLWSSFR